MGIIACLYRAAEWRHKEIEPAAHDLLSAWTLCWRLAPPLALNERLALPGRPGTAYCRG